jgi:hypothetical protein
VRRRVAVTLLAQSRRVATWAALWLVACATPKTPEIVVGTFTVFNRESPYLIAAPHGEFDENTAEITYDFCEQVRWDCLVAEGFRGSTARINVNRPTAGTRLAQARFTEGAAAVYANYVKRIRRLSPRVTFYVEVHGHKRAALSEIIDIATIGVSPSQAVFMREVLERAFAAHGIKQYTVRIDVLEPIRYNATHARKFGVLSFLSPALHIELPGSARREHRRELVASLTEALPIIAREAFPFQYIEPERAPPRARTNAPSVSIKVSEPD